MEISLLNNATRPAFMYNRLLMRASSPNNDPITIRSLPWPQARRRLKSNNDAISIARKLIACKLHGIACVHLSAILIMKSAPFARANAERTHELR